MNGTKNNYLNNTSEIDLPTIASYMAALATREKAKDPTEKTNDQDRETNRISLGLITEKAGELIQILGLDQPVSSAADIINEPKAETVEKEISQLGCPKNLTIRNGVYEFGDKKYTPNGNVSSKFIDFLIDNIGQNPVTFYDFFVRRIEHKEPGYVDIKGDRATRTLGKIEKVLSDTNLFDGIIVRKRRKGHGKKYEYSIRRGVEVVIENDNEPPMLISQPVFNLDVNTAAKEVQNLDELQIHNIMSITRTFLESRAADTEPLDLDSVINQTLSNIKDIVSNDDNNEEDIKKIIGIAWRKFYETN
ncbi:MAG: hypothetical protein LBK50_00705 [Candidatus Nomurabacteria bacterium]|jgi:hypothetical protein|nr:hypothetical protein [Candidatus Nomurabacteria bacterium]